MSSDSSRQATRRAPQQERAEKLVAKILAVAADAIADVGYEKTTMTAIAKASGVSIGAVYQYFPNKEAVGRALRAMYAEEMEERWVSFDAGAESLSVDGLVDRLFDMMLELMRQRPAYLILVSAPLGYKRDAAQRLRLRQRFADVFRRRNPNLSDARALQIANVSFQVMKGLSAIYEETPSVDKRTLEEEFRTVLKAYLGQRLRRR